MINIENNCQTVATMLISQTPAKCQMAIILHHTSTLTSKSLIDQELSINRIRNHLEIHNMISCLSARKHNQWPTPF